MRWSWILLRSGFWCQTHISCRSQEPACFQVHQCLQLRDGKAVFQWFKVPPEALALNLWAHFSQLRKNGYSDFNFWSGYGLWHFFQFYTVFYLLGIKSVCKRDKITAYCSANCKLFSISYIYFLERLNFCCFSICLQDLWSGQIILFFLILLS